MSILLPRETAIGGLVVRRALPNHPVRSVGPFVFFDHMGPLTVEPEQDIDVPPHPHIGLATMTWLFDGGLLHRDSTGSEQPIRPGDVNWMTAGRGIVHSERRLPERVGQRYRFEGIQVWVGLPQALAESDPSFSHHPAATLPVFEQSSARVTVIAGHWYGRTSPVPVLSGLGYAAVEQPATTVLDVPSDHSERAIYLVAGAVEVDGRPLAVGQMAVLAAGNTVGVQATTPSRWMLIGGEPLDGPRYLNWNFVSHDRNRLEQAREDWREHRFALIDGDSNERVELPEPRVPR